MDLYEELRAVVAALDAAGIPYALAGGLAVSIYTVPRATEDIDILIGSEQTEHAVHALASCGFSQPGRPTDVLGGRLRIVRLLKIDGPDLLPLDLLVPRDPAIERLLDDRTAHDLGGRPVSVVGVRGLRASKEMRRSPQDIADLEALGPDDERAP